jgi:hypothetical protein
MFIMVLNDGETFTSLEGCRLVAVENNPETDEIEELIKTIGSDDFDLRKAWVVREFGEVPVEADFG